MAHINIWNRKCPQWRRQTTTSGSLPCSFQEVCEFFKYPDRMSRDWVYGLMSSSEKQQRFNHLQMLEQRQHLLLKSPWVLVRLGIQPEPPKQQIGTLLNWVTRQRDSVKTKALLTTVSSYYWQNAMDTALTLASHSLSISVTDPLSSWV